MHGYKYDQDAVIARGAQIPWIQSLRSAHYIIFSAICHRCLVILAPLENSP